MNGLGWAALTLAATLTSAGIARADTFVLENTSPPNCQYVQSYCDDLTGNGYVVDLPDGSTELVGSDSGNPGTSPEKFFILDGVFNTASLIATADHDETLVFDFKFLDLDTYGSCYDEPFQVVNGQHGAVLCQGLPQPVFGTNLPEFGSVTFNLNKGDTYGFAIYSDSSEGPGTFTFKLASATYRDGAPEPATWAMMLTGFLGVGAGLRHRRRFTARCAKY